MLSESHLLHSLLCVVTLLTAGYCHGQDRASYDFVGGSAASSDADATTSAGDFTLGAFTGGDPGPPTGVAISSGTETAFVRGFATGDLATDGDELSEAILNDAYFSFTLDPLGNSTNLSQLAFDHIFTSPDALFSLAVMSDVTGFTAGSELFTSSSEAAGTLNQVVDLSGISALQGLTGSVEFRFYMFDDSDTQSAIQRVDNVLLSSTLPTVFVDWDLDGSGDWGTAVNWDGDALPGDDTNVRFGQAFITSGDVTVDVNTASQLNRIVINNSNSITLADSGGTITLTGDSEIDAAGAARHFIGATLAGTEGLNKTGAGDLEINGTNTYTGTTDVQEGSLRVGSIASIDNTLGGTLNVAAGADLVLSGDALGAGFCGTIVPDITGDGDLILSTSLTIETVSINAAKTFNGRVLLNGGTLVVSHANALGVGGTGEPTEATRTEIPGRVVVDNILVDATSQLQLTGGVTIASETLDLNDRADTNTTAHLSNLSGNNTWNGVVNLDTGDGNYIIESQAGTLTIGGDIVDVDDVSGQTATLRLTGAGNGVISGSFVDNDGDTLNVLNDNNNIAVVKEGSGTWTIGTASAQATDYYQGNTTVAGGTLEVIAGVGNTGELASPVITVQSGATLNVSSFGTYNMQVGQTIGGAGTITANTIGYFDDGSISPGDNGTGTLDVTGNLNLSTFNNTPTGSLNFELSDTTAVDTGANDLIDVSGSLTLNKGSASNSFSVNITPQGTLSAGTYTLVRAASVGGTATGADFNANLVDENGAAIPNTRFSLGVSSDANSVNLNVTGAAANLTWIGSTDTWNVDSAPNWTGGDTVFMNLDRVTFNDSGNQTNVNVTSELQPGSVTFANNSKDYTISGAAVKGTAALNVNGTGRVTLANSGSTYGTITAANGSNLEIGNDANQSVTIGGNLIAQSGSTIRVAQAGYTVSAPVTNGEDFENFGPPTSGVVFTGNAATNNPAMPGWQLIDGRSATSTQTGNDDVVFELANSTISGSNALNQTTANTDFPNTGDAHNGSMAISPLDTSGALDTITATLGQNDPSGGFADASVVFAFQDQDNYMYAQVNQNGTLAIRRVVADSRDTLISDASAAPSFANDTPWDVTLVHNSLTGEVTFTVDDGTNVGTINVTDAALQTDGLVGFGSHNDAWTVDDLSISTETNPVFEATIDGDLDLLAGATLELDIASPASFDMLNITGEFTANGTIDINALAGFSGDLGDTYDLLDFDLASGSPTFDLPSLSAGLEWDTSSFLTDGVLSIVSDAPGDFDQDGDVDGNDFLTWQRNPSVGSLIDWQNNYGTGVPLTASAPAVPEPTTAVLLALSSLAMLSSRKRN